MYIGVPPHRALTLPHLGARWCPQVRRFPAAGFGVEGRGFGVWGLGFGVWCLGFRVKVIGVMVWCAGSSVESLRV